MKDLSYYRQEIDGLDRDIVRMILRRADLAHEIGRVKRDRNETVYRPDREKEVYQNVQAIAESYYQDNPDSTRFPAEALQSIYRELMSGTIYIEGGPIVAYMGPQGSFSHMATVQRFGSSVRSLPLPTITDVFRTLEAGGEATFGMVPVDNTTGGSVMTTLDAFLESGLKIYAEHFSRIQQHLLYHDEIALDDIRRIYSIRIGQEQCRDWLAAHLNLRDVEFVETNSTAAAARLAAERKDGAAIGSDLAAELYNLRIIARSIQDSTNNITRFWVIGNEQCKPTGDDKTSVIVGVHDRPGSLFSILDPFHMAGINLTKIESRITRRNYGEYNFYIDFQGHFEDPHIADILRKLEERSSFLKILGSYPAAKVL